MKLTAPTASTTTVETLKINSFSVDLDLKEMHVAYSEISGKGDVLSEKIITIVEPDFTAAITNASANAGADIYTPLKNSLYAEISASTLLDGSIL